MKRFLIIIMLCLMSVSSYAREKWLVNLPDGDQIYQYMEGYFDPSAVLWKGPLPAPLTEDQVGGIVKNGPNLMFNQAQYDARQAAKQARAAAEEARKQGIAQAKDRLANLDLSNVPDVAAVNAVIADILKALELKE